LPPLAEAPRIDTFVF